MSFWQWLLLLLALSATVSIFHRWISVKNEHHNRILFAEKLLQDDDEEALQIFEKWREHIHPNTLNGKDEAELNRIVEQMKKTFDTLSSENYIVSITVCDTDEKLLLEDGKTIVDCRLFFEEKILNYGRPTTNRNLFEMRHNFFDFSYLGVVEVSREWSFYIEFASKKQDAYLQEMLRENNYSVAYYRHLDLVKQIGAFVYPLKLSQNQKLSDKTFFSYEEFDHLLVFTEVSGDEQILIISKRIPTIRDAFSVFSLVFIASLFLVLLIVLSRKGTYNMLFKSFAQRLQLTILGIVLATFVVIGTVSIVYVQRLNAQKNQKVLREKTHSFLLLMEQNFAEETASEIVNSSELQEKLIDFSNAFFTDVFFYDTSGQIVAKSVVDEVLQSSSRDAMNAEAFRQLSKEHRNFYIQKETLNEQTYYSSYVPFRNYHNALVGYLNLPHFAKQTELRQEITTFVKAYINLFIGLIIFVFLLVFLIVKQLTKPLVETERQMAWNEMAKQIAHEIKNPLTPMKLNVQQIQKAWNDRKEDFDERMKRFSTVMVEQIDTLSIIASEFAHFAQQSNVELEEVNVKQCLEKAILLMNSDGIIHSEIAENTESTTVLANEKQLSRAFVNILKNAKQAVSDSENPHIKVTLSSSETLVSIAIQDNGKGIPEEIRDRIFEPNFTTKTSGMGLGLAITKNIIEHFNGTISFVTDANGTTFRIEL